MSNIFTIIITGCCQSLHGDCIHLYNYRLMIGPDSLVVRASASGSEGRGFAPRPRHTQGVKNGTGSSLADACNKRVVLGRYKNAGRYLLLVMSQ